MFDLRTGCYCVIFTNCCFQRMLFCEWRRAASVCAGTESRNMGLSIPSPCGI